MTDMTRAQKRMLASDLDGTLLGDAGALERFAEWVAENRDALSLVYVTGRFFGSVVEAVDESPLPEPDAVIAAVGTNIHRYPDGEILKEWHDQAGDNWNAHSVRQVLQDEGSLELQEEEFQSEFKVSYYTENADSRKLEAFRRRLQSAGIDAEMIYSSSRDLDFLPGGMNKGAAVTFLADRWHVAAAGVLVSGNTGNDKALFEQGFTGIIVANAESELKAVKGPYIYHARSSFAAGVLEGIKYWREQR